MRSGRLAVWAFVAGGLSCATAGGQVTRVATFENYVPLDGFKPSFTDPLSGITFRNSTHPSQGFIINGSPDGRYFGGGHYLTAGGGPYNGMAPYFGFTADLPAPANHVRIDMVYGSGFLPGALLRGFDALGNLVAQQYGPTNIGGQNVQFSLEISDAAYSIRMFQVSVNGGVAGYDNVRYTIVPEPALAGLAMFAISAIACRPPRTRARLTRP